MHRFKAKQAWLEKYKDRLLTNAQRDLLERFAADEFLLIFQQLDDGAKLHRVTERHRRTFRPVRPAARKASPAQVVQSKPIESKPIERPAEHYSSVAAPGLIWVAIDDDGFELVDQRLGDIRLKRLNELIWQAIVDSQPIDSPTDLQDAAQQAEQWLRDCASGQAEQLQFAKMQLEVMELAGETETRLDEERRRITQAESWLQHYDQMMLIKEGSHLARHGEQNAG